nr:ATP synthase F0 subunit 8 [Clytomelegena kabakovi]
MPQMAPLNWMILFMLFIIIFSIFNNLNYFSFSYPITENPLKISLMKLHWKW